MAVNRNKVALKNGLFLGASIIGITFALKALNKFENSTVIIALTSLLFIFSFLSIIQGKKYLGNKSFRDSFSTGFKTTVFGAIILGVWTYIFFTFIDTDILSTYIIKEETSIIENAAKENIKEIKYTPEQIESGITQMKQFMAPKSLGLKIGFFTIILGAITSLVTTTLSELIWMRNAKQ